MGTYEEVVMREKAVLMGFCDGKKIEEGEFDIVEKYSCIGITHIGYCFSKREPQARLTKCGKKLLGLIDCD